MKFLKSIGIVAALSLVITFLLIIVNVRIVQPIPTDEKGKSNSNFESEWFHKLENEHPNSDISVIKTQYTTGGTMWRLVESSCGAQRGDVLLVSLFEPRLLKENDNFNIDFHYAFAVCTPKLFRPLLQNDLKIVIPTKMYAIPYYGEEEQHNVAADSFRVMDLNFAGKLTIFLRIFLLLFVLDLLLFAIKWLLQKATGRKQDI